VVAKSFQILEGRFCLVVYVIDPDKGAILLSSSFALFGEEIGIGEKRPTVQNLENSTTSSQKHGGRRWNLLQLSWQC
jgi:hypothetical protein